jgi:hypothetical protein
LCQRYDQPVTVQDDRKRILGDNPAAKKAVTDSMFIRLVVYAYQDFDRHTPLKCLLSRSTKGKELITYQNRVGQNYAQKNGKSRTIANKFGMYWYVTRAWLTQ